MLGDLTLTSDVDRQRREEYKHSCYKDILRLWGKREAERESAEADPPYHIARKRGHDIIVRRLRDGESPRAIVEDLMKDFPEISKSLTSVPGNRLHRRTPTSSSASLPVRETLIGTTGRKSRRRIPWREWEDDILRKAKREGTSFSKVVKSLPDRLVGDCYDRWRYLTRNHLA